MKSDRTHRKLFINNMLVEVLLSHYVHAKIQLCIYYNRLRSREQFFRSEKNAAYHIIIIN